MYRIDLLYIMQVLYGIVVTMFSSLRIRANYVCKL